MNRTENYQLPQWEMPDRILMEDFNSAMSSIEAGLSQNAREIASGLEKVEDAAANASAAAQKAQSTADAAKSTAGAAYCPTYKPYVMGTYRGNGNMAGVSQSIRLGFKPSAVLVCNESSSTMCPGAILAVSDYFKEYLEITATGFTVIHQTSTGYPQTNLNGVKYCYIAFR